MTIFKRILNTELEGVGRITMYPEQGPVTGTRFQKGRETMEFSECTAPWSYSELK
jgi:hypothetical protein